MAGMLRKPSKQEWLELRSEFLLTSLDIGLNDFLFEKGIISSSKNIIVGNSHKHVQGWIEERKVTAELIRKNALGTAVRKHTRRISKKMEKNVKHLLSMKSDLIQILSNKIEDIIERSEKSVNVGNILELKTALDIVKTELGEPTRIGANFNTNNDESIKPSRGNFGKTVSDLRKRNTESK